MTGTENTTGGNGRGRLMNVLDQYIPMRSFLPMMVVLGSLFIGGLKMEQFILDGFSAMDAKIAQQSAQIANLSDYMRSRDTMRDDQVRQINGRIDDVNLKQEAASGQITALRLDIGNIVQDIAVMKCQVSHRC